MATKTNSSTGIEDGDDLEANIDQQIEETNALARRHLVGQLEDVLNAQTIVLIKSPSDGSISFKTNSGATIMFTSVGNDAKLEVAIAYNMKSTI